MHHVHFSRFHRFHSIHPSGHQGRGVATGPPHVTSSHAIPLTLTQELSYDEATESTVPPSLKLTFDGDVDGLRDEELRLDQHAADVRPLIQPLLNVAELQRPVLEHHLRGRELRQTRIRDVLLLPFCLFTAQSWKCIRDWGVR